MATKVLVVRAGGLIGHHPVNHLIGKGYWIRGVDIRHPEFELWYLGYCQNCSMATRGIKEVCDLAAELVRIIIINAQNTRIVPNNSQIDIKTPEAALKQGILRRSLSSGH